jgi:hypothetical protein
MNEEIEKNISYLTLNFAAFKCAFKYCCVSEAVFENIISWGQFINDISQYWLIGRLYEKFGNQLISNINQLFL